MCCKDLHLGCWHISEEHFKANEMLLLGLRGQESVQFAWLYAPIHRRPDPFKGTENAT